MADLLRIGILDLSVERRTLVVDVRHDVVFVLGITEARADAVDHVAAAVRVRKRRVGGDARGIEILARDVGGLVALLVFVLGAILRAELRVFRDGFRVGDVSLDLVVARRRRVIEIAHPEVVVGVDHFARRGVDRRTDLRNGGGIRSRIGAARIVAVTARTVHRDRAAVFAELGPIDGEQTGVVTAVGGVAVSARQAVTALAELPAVGRAPRIVGLVAEARTDHEVLVVRNLPLDAGIETMVVVLRVGITRGRKGVDRRIFVPFVLGRTVGRAGPVEKIAALKRHLIPLAPRVGIVQAEGVDLRHAALRTGHVGTHAAAGRAARNAEDVLEREILLVDVVEQRQQRETAVAVEDVDVAARIILEFGLGSGVGVVAEGGVELAELAAAHVLARNDVDGLVAFAVVHARKFGVVAQFVVDLDAVYGFGRQRLDGRSDVVAEELLAVDEDLFDLLALRFDRTVGHGDARHLLEQPLHVGVGRNLEGAGIVAHRVAFLRRAQRLGLLHHGGDLLGRRHHRHLAERRPVGSDREGFLQIVVAEEGEDGLVFAVGERGNAQRTVVSGRIKSFPVGGLRGSDLHDRACDALIRICIDHRRRNGPLLCERNRCEEGEQCSDNELFHLFGSYLSWIAGRRRYDKSSAFPISSGRIDKNRVSAGMADTLSGVRYPCNRLRPTGRTACRSLRDTPLSAQGRVPRSKLRRTVLPASCRGACGPDGARASAAIRHTVSR